MARNGSEFDSLDIIILSELGSSDGGRETWIANFIPELLKQRPKMSVRVICRQLAKQNALRDVLATHSRVHVLEIALGNIPGPISLRFSWNLMRALRGMKSARYTLVLGNPLVSIAVYLGGLGRRTKHDKLFCWLRSIGSRELGLRLSRMSRWIFDVIERVSLKLIFDVVIANGKDTADYYKSLGIDCEVIPNGINLVRFSSAIPRLGGGLITVAFIGRLARIKGLGEFLELAASMTKAVKRRARTRFVVYGDGPLANLARAAHDAGEIEWYGSVNNTEMPRVLESVDVAVALTFLDSRFGGGGVSNALVEQMAAGCTILAWDNPIFRNALKPDEAIFVTQGSVPELVNAIERVANDAALAPKLSGVAIAGAQRYSIVDHVKKFLELLNADPETRLSP